MLAGKDKGKRGTVLKVLTNGKAMVNNINTVKKHVRGNPQTGVTGGIVEQEAAIQLSNVGLYNPATGKADRVGFKTLEDGRKVRFCRACQEVVD